jgi:hypothetical protein
VHRWLVEAGHEVFLDQDLRDGIAVGDEWEQRLRWAGAMICVITSAYLDSTWCAAEAVSPDRWAAGCCRCAPSRMRLTPC